MSESQTVVPGDVSKGAEYITRHPQEYGFDWASGAIGKGSGPAYVELRKDAPHVVVTPESLPLFAATFPNVLVKSVNGTSVKVSCDRVNRDTIGKDHSVKNAALQLKIVSNVLLGVILRTIGTVTKYVGADGQSYNTLAEAQAAVAPESREDRVSKAQAFLAMCQENGVASETARNMARVQWPDVFEQVETEDDDQEYRS